MKRNFLIAIMLLLVTGVVRADEGMWLPFRIKSDVIAQMHQLGFLLDADDIYSSDKPSFNDAVVGLGTEGRPFSHFCTGGLVSDKGLFITNHHCGYGFIQKHSTMQNDYLTDGFWAYDHSQELTNIGLTASIMRRMEDVTEIILEGVTENLSHDVRDSIIKLNILAVEKEAIEGTHYLAKVNPFYNGTEYYLSVYEIFNDVRLVGAPPSAIGKFGGDTDNWVWPRHTGDFAMFRIYAGPDNKPAAYSPDNKPYSPDKFFEINGNSVAENDFTFIMGYPGTTQEYLPSAAIELQKNIQNPIRIQLREMRIETMKRHMEQSQEVRIKYSSKVAGVANAWKKWIGEIQGLDRFDVIYKKQELEKEFENFAASNPKYNEIISDYNTIYSQINAIAPYQEYYFEGAYQVEIIRFISAFSALAKAEKTVSLEQQENMISRVRSFYKDYYLPIDKIVFEKLMTEFSSNVPIEYQPEQFTKLENRFKNDFKAMSDWLFESSLFTDSTKLITFIDGYTIKKAKTIHKDPLYQLYSGLVDAYNMLLAPKFKSLYQELPPIHKLYMQGLREMQHDKTFFPDANSTFRIAFGKVQGYNPKDAIKYHWRTTIDGIIQKNNPEIYDYDVPKKLLELYANKDFGSYSDATGEVPVCFSATNHTTGGNSGSPVLDANGRLVGLNFDRAWEGVMSDLYYNPEICRNISIDIRYALFIVDKYAGAQNLIDEMSIIK
ncbi:MAG: S46 family peptidase [Salinivirgaceae bacterium]|nr:S46 family peptidase [Salinivirgaceae bacterium]